MDRLLHDFADPNWCGKIERAREMDEPPIPSCEDIARSINYKNGTYLPHLYVDPTR